MSPVAGTFRPLSPGFWRRYVTTLRPYLCFVSGSAGLVGLAIAPRLGSGALLGSMAVFLVSYGLGQALTDVDQVDTDTRSSPYRPLVRGEILGRDVRATSVAGLVLCAGWLAWLNVWTLVPAGLAVAGLWSYTALKRRWWGGPAWNSAVVALLPFTGWLAGSRGRPVAIDGDVALAVLSVFGTYGAFVLLGYLKDVEADRATGYRTVPVRFGRRAAVLHSALFAGPGLVGSAALVASAPSGLWLALWGPGLVLVADAHRRALHVTRDADAHPAVVRVVLGFTFVHVGEAAALRPDYAVLGFLVAVAAVAMTAARPVRSQV